MAIKNDKRSTWVLSLPDLQRNAHVLEIGFGSGMDICRVARCVPVGLVAGIDHSEVMLRKGHTPQPFRNSSGSCSVAACD
jgi:ubiquinone/menaquinone biosynthesis C-methylase UbiE